MSYDGKDVELLVVGTGKEEPASMWSQTESQGKSTYTVLYNRNKTRMKQKN